MQYTHILPFETQYTTLYEYMLSGVGNSTTAKKLVAITTDLWNKDVKGNLIGHYLYFVLNPLKITHVSSRSIKRLSNNEDL